MARKRKIPVRKHHGIRDPLKQLEQREKKLANVTNNPPEQNDQQRASYRFKQFKQLADATKAGKKLKLSNIGQEDKPKKLTKNNNKQQQQQQLTNGSKHRPIKQFADETDEDYLKRINRITNASVREAQYEAKYGVNVVRNSQTGEITVQKRPKNEIDELLKQKRNERILAKRGRKKQATPKATMDPKTSRELIKLAYKEPISDDNDNDDDDDRQPRSKEPEYKRDTFKFGEIVHAPPSLTALPRKAVKNETVPRPGRKANLLLKSMLDRNQEDSNHQSQSKTKSKSNGVKKKQAGTVSASIAKAQLKGKRKELPVATRTMLEGERNKMVNLYRELKKAREAERL